jgi:hypothetical protein
VSPWLYVPLLTIGIGIGCVGLYWLVVKPAKFDPHATVSKAWLNDHNGGPYTGGGK